MEYTEFIRAASPPKNRKTEAHIRGFGLIHYINYFDVL